jgi:DNA invertase Pin-like site-specific DNA recombinase
MMYPLVRELAVDGVPVTVTCRVLGFSKQAFYRWKRDPVSQRDRDDAPHRLRASFTSARSRTSTRIRSSGTQ